MSASSDNNNNSGKITLPDWFNDKKREEEVLSAIQNQKISSVPFILPTCKKFDISQNRELDLSSGMFINPLTLKEEKSSQHDGKFYLTDVGYFILKSFKGDLCSLGVVGPARKGKSYLLSKILNVKHAFRLGHTMNSETRGIWVGTQLAQGNDSKKIVCFDTEGINAHDTTTDNDNTIFVLTVLLTSTLVYNSSAVPSATDLDSMGFITSLVERIAIKATVDESGDDFPKYFPDMIWVLRDVLLDTVTEAGIVSPRDYLVNKVLNYKKGFGAESSRNATKQAIMSFFPSVDCYTVSPPTTDPNILKDIEDVSPSKLDHRFISEIDTVIEVLREKCKLKMIGDVDKKKAVNGEVLANVAYLYVSAINQPGMVPSVLSASEQAEYISCNKTIQKAFDQYVSEMSKLKPPVSTDTIMQLHSQELMKSIEIVKKEAFVADIENIKKYTKELSDMIFVTDSKFNVVGGFLENIMKDNHTKSLQSNSDLIQKMYTELWSKVKTNSYNFGQFKKDIDNLLKEFKEKSLEVSREDVITKFLTQTLPADEEKVKSLAGYQKKVAEEEMKNKVYQAELEKSKKDLEDQRKLQLENAKNNQEMLSKVMEEQRERSQQMMEQMMKEKKESEERMATLQQSLHKELAEASKQNVEMMKAQFKQMQETTQKMMEQQDKNMLQMSENIKAIANRPINVSTPRSSCLVM